MNHPITKPMLAGKCESMNDLSFPVLATPKLDGIRCLKINGQALSRSFKPISNRFIREWIEAHLPDGVEGELMLRDGTFSETASAIGCRDGRPDFVFTIFDFVSGDPGEPYEERVDKLVRLSESLSLPGDHVKWLVPVEIVDVADLEDYEMVCLQNGYEGVMIRTPGSPYKCGRSTANEGYLLKIKRFEDAEAVVLDTYEGMSNLNPAEKDAFGRTKRSLAQAGLVGRGELGGFVVSAVDSNVVFRLGYNHVLGGIDRVSLWERRETLVGRLVKFRHQPSGAKEAPRFPKFIGFRETWDLRGAGLPDAAQGEHSRNPPPPSNSAWQHHVALW
jgi:DNA ligase-1